MIGRSLHQFEITAKLGEGGMGEVYRATDTKLGREVAVKVLPAAFTDDPERLARFEREAKVLASLNHPNVAGIYEVGEDGGTHFLAMELAEGQTLSERLAQGGMTLEEALPIARQVAGALEAAHALGIVHRDLKPANVMLDRKGGVKVLDFGLAKAWEGGSRQADLSLSPTLTAQMTQAGVILGTAGYMSPEQARGHEADHRSDVWSFGVVLHEMVTGERLFQADTVSDTLARVLMAEPDWPRLERTQPAAIFHLLRRCLERDPGRRLQAIGEARIAIEDQLAGRAEITEAEPAERLDARGRAAVRWALPAAVVGLAAGWALAALVGWPGGEREISAAVPYAVIPPTGSVLVTEDVNGIDISPDGRKVAFVATASDASEQRIYVKTGEDPEPRELPGTEGARLPFFSPDGEWIAYFTDRELRKVSLRGGTPLALAEAQDRRGGVWHPNGWIYFVPHSTGPIFRVPQGGGQPEPVTRLDPERNERTHRWPALLPDGGGLLYTSDTQATTEFYDDARIELLDLETGEMKVVLEGSSRAAWSPSGHLLFARDGSLWAAPFDLGKREVTGPAELALPDVSTVVASGAVQFAVAPNGSLVYVPGGKTTEIYDLVWTSLDGENEPASAESGRYFQSRLSPDGSRAVLASTEAEVADLWVLDLDRDTLSRLTFEGSNSDPVWSRDGQWVYFSSSREDYRSAVFTKRADGSGNAKLVWETKGMLYPDDVSPDGRFLLVEVVEEIDGLGVNTDLWVVDLSGEREPFPYLEDPHETGFATFSPDSRWVAYSSTESGSSRVYVRPFPSADGKWQISRNVSREPRWAPDGKSLFYRSLDGIQAVDVDLDDGFSAGRSRVIRRGGIGPPYGQTYSISGDSQRILELRPQERDRDWRLHVLPGWTDGLRDKLAGR